MKVESKFIDVKMGCFEKVNDEFTKCTISVNSCDQIANGTKFREEAVENARPTLAYAPVIGYLKDDGTMGGHGIEYKITEDGFEEVIKTVPFGVVIKGTDRWQMMTKPNGEQEKYMVVDCYLWNRYEKAINIVKENKCNQSMEVNINSYEYKDNYLDITDFSYSALCILGEDVTPAFNLAKIRTSDKFSKDEIKSCYSEMIEALDNFLNFEGGENMNEEDYKKKKCEDEDEDYKKKKCEDDEDDEDFKKKKCSEDEEEDNQEDYKKKKCEDDDTEDDEEDYKKKKCEDEDDEEFKKKKCSEEEYEQQIMTLKADYSDLLAEYEALKEKYSALESEVSELREYKKSKEDFEKDAELEANVFSKFEALKKVEGYEDIYNKRFELSEDELNLRLKALAFDNGIIIKKSKTFSAKPEKKILPIDNVKKEKNPSEWDLILKK